MLIVSLTVRPEGDASRDREIGRMEIANDGNSSPSGDICDYDVAVSGEAKRRENYAEVRSHARADGAWQLVQRAIARIA